MYGLPSRRTGRSIRPLVVAGLSDVYLLTGYIDDPVARNRTKSMPRAFIPPSGRLFGPSGFGCGAYDLL